MARRPTGSWKPSTPVYAKGDYGRLAALGLYVTPTLNMSRILAYLDREDHRNDAGLALIGPAAQDL